MGNAVQAGIIEHLLGLSKSSLGQVVLLGLPTHKD